MKKFFKNNLKTIVVAGVTAIICISGTVYATLKYSASEVSYKEGKNVEQALNELYSKEQIKSGELFLKMLLNREINLSHNYPHGYTGIFYLNDLDFSNIKSFGYKFVVNSNGVNWQQVNFIDNNTSNPILSLTASDTGICEINGASNDIMFTFMTSAEGTNTFLITSYTTMDGFVHTN